MTTPLSKRSLLKMGGWAALAATAALVGCSKTEPESTAAATSEAAPAATAPEPLNIAFAYVGPVGDAGWTYAHDLKAARRSRPSSATRSRPAIVENVPEAA
jgi:basic membrane protein A